MNTKLIYALTLISGLGYGLVAGIFFAFSTFVMKALTRLPPEQGMAAMQAINVTVLNRWFFAAFFGTAACCLVLVVFSLFNWGSAASAWLLIGSVLYLGGTILVTILFNVPLNNALAAVEAGSGEGAARWADYASAWTTWNHVRTLAALGGAASLTIALCLTEYPTTRKQNKDSKTQASVRSSLPIAKGETQFK